MPGRMRPGISRFPRANTRKGQPWAMDANLTQLARRSSFCSGNVFNRYRLKANSEPEEWFRESNSPILQMPLSNTRPVETALVIDKGLAVGREKSPNFFKRSVMLRHLTTSSYVSTDRSSLSESLVQSIHRIFCRLSILRTMTTIAPVPARIAGISPSSRTIFKLPGLFRIVEWLNHPTPDPSSKCCRRAFQVWSASSNLSMVMDSTARLRRNLLHYAGWVPRPAAIIRPEDRSTYLPSALVNRANGLWSSLIVTDCMYAAVGPIAYIILNPGSQLKLMLFWKELATGEKKFRRLVRSKLSNG